jgi:hypothetical protein
LPLAAAQLFIPLIGQLGGALLTRAETHTVIPAVLLLQLRELLWLEQLPRLAIWVVVGASLAPTELALWIIQAR